MNRIFVDTSAWMAIVDSDDINHRPAVTFQGDLAESSVLIVTNYILDELYTLVLMDLGYRKAVEIKQKLEAMAEARILEVVWVDQILNAAGWTVFERFNRDKQWSFTDCVSYAVMKRLGVTEVFSFDHHFEQMSFIRRP